MGGAGAGHKSVRAQESRRVNIQKARAARKRAPLPWRSGMESRVIEQLVWQWWVECSGEWLVVSGAKRQRQVARRGVESGPQPSRRAQSVTGYANRPWARYRVARFLGVSHTWVNKLVKRFEADPDRMRRKMAAFAPVSIEKLERAREETRRQRERGWLRGPIRYRRVKVTLQGRKRKVMVPTETEKRRRQEERAPMPVRYAELPAWASGLPLPGGTGTAAGRRPRPVPFAFRRRRR
jgi:hypothetical protein